MMRRNTLNFLVDFLTLLAIFAMVATGLVLRFVLPPGSGGRHGEGGLLLWGWGRHDWGDVHFWAAVALAALLVVHVALHWSWVCTMVQRSLRGTNSGQPGVGKRNAYGVGFLLLVVLVFGGFTWYARTAVTHVSERWESESRPASAEHGVPQHGQEAGHGAGHEQIRGSMSLVEVAAATGVSVETLKSELGLPKDTSAEERLGRLAREYGFSMDKVRDIVSKHNSRPQGGQD
jgi:phosphotransferase system  glucose/maltose/N-acetylglucosamine-specific IIC component